MKPTNRIIPALLIGCALALDFVTPTSAIENLKLRIHCPDVVLSWPSVEGESYIVQHRETLSTNTPWVTLTNSLPAESGTNFTTFTHSNRVDCPPGQVFGMMSASGGESSTLRVASLLTVEQRRELKAAREAERLSALLEKCELEGRLPYDWELKNQPPLPPLPDEVRASILAARGSRLAESAELGIAEASLDGPPDPGGENDPQPEDGGGTPEPGTGFYQVVRVGINWFGITNGTILSGKVTLPLEFGDPDTNRALAVVFLSHANSDDNLDGSEFPEFPYEVTNHLTEFGIRLRLRMAVTR